MVEHEIEEVIELEQDIITGVETETTNEIRAEQLLKHLLSFIDKHREQPPIVFRTASIFLSNYSVSDKIFNDLVKKLGGA